MLGATEAVVPVPPKPSDFSPKLPKAARDWSLGKDLITTCMATHETATCVTPNAPDDIPVFDELILLADYHRRLLCSTMANSRRGRRNGISRAESMSFHWQIIRDNTVKNASL